jgi:hypothetical protein
MWFLSHPAYVAAAPTYGCVRGKFGALNGNAYDMSIAGPGPCGITAAAMCRAVGLTSANTSIALATQLRQLQSQSTGSGAATSTSSAAAWKPGERARARCRERAAACTFIAPHIPLWVSCASS